MRKIAKQKNGVATSEPDPLSALSNAGRHQADEALQDLATTEKRPGRPRRAVPTVQRTVSFTEDALNVLKKLSTRSCREGFDNPDFSKTVRVAIRLAATAPDQAVKQAFDDELDG